MKQILAGFIAIVLAGTVVYYGRSDAPPRVASNPYDRPQAAAAPADSESTVRNPQSATETAPSEIESAVWSLLDAAAQGEVGRYANLLTGPLRDRFLETARDEGTAAGLEKSLYGVKGIAVMAPQANDDDTWTVEVEFQYEDRKEGQRFSLRRLDGQWRFDRIEPARPLEQAIPYGTPVDAAPGGALP